MRHTIHLLVVLEAVSNCRKSVAIRFICVERPCCNIVLFHNDGNSFDQMRKNLMQMMEI